MDRLDGEWLTITAAADEMGLRADTVRRAINRGLLEGRKVGRQWFIAPSAIEEYRRAHLGRKGWVTRRRGN